MTSNIQNINIRKCYDSYVLSTKDPSNWKIIAIRPIKEGENLTSPYKNRKLTFASPLLNIKLIESGESRIVSLKEHGVPSDIDCRPNEIELPWCFMNHSCSPNTREIWEKDKLIVTKNFIASKDISIDEEITFDYCCEQYEYLKPFHCKCGDKHCRDFISGHKNLNDQEKSRIKDRISYFLSLKLKEVDCNFDNQRVHA